MAAISDEEQLRSGVEGDLVDLYEHAPFGYVSTSEDWTVLRVNRTFADLVGVPAEELVGRPFGELLAAGSRIYHETHYAPLVRLQDSVEEVAADLDVVGDESLPVLMTSVRRPRGAAGTEVVRTAVMPAHQRRRFEAEVQRMRRRAEDSEHRANVLHRVVAALATSTDVADVVAAVADSLGTDVARSAGVWIPTDADTLGRLTSSGAVGRTALPVTSDDVVAQAWRTAGAVIDHERGLAAAPLAAAPEPSGVVGVVLDRLLPDAGAGRTIDIGPETLRGPEGQELLTTIGQEVGQALRRARLYERKDWLLGMAAHDLQTPLTAVIGYAETLRDLHEGTLGDRDRTMLERIVAVGRGMTALIDDVLEMSEIERGGISVQRRPADLVELVEEAVEVVDPVARDKDISIAVRRSSELAPVPMDVRRIRQVIDNLLSNAIKYSQTGTDVEVRVLDDASWAVVEVEDHGPGIAEEELEQVFQPFRRAGARPTAGERSTGLGLSIARHIAEAHDGRLEVSSRLGEGSTFRLRLPRGETSAAGRT